MDFRDLVSEKPKLCQQSGVCLPRDNRDLLADSLSCRDKFKMNDVFANCWLLNYNIQCLLHELETLIGDKSNAKGANDLSTLNHVQNEFWKHGSSFLSAACTIKSSERLRNGMSSDYFVIKLSWSLSPYARLQINQACEDAKSLRAQKQQIIVYSIGFHLNFVCEI